MRGSTSKMLTSSPIWVLFAHGGSSRHTGFTGNFAQRAMNSSTWALTPGPFGNPTARALLAQDPCTFIAIRALVNPLTLSKYSAGAFSPSRGAALGGGGVRGLGIMFSLFVRHIP